MRVRRRIRSMAILEAGNIALYGVVFFGILGLPPRAANVVGFGAFAFLLIQGSLYWVTKLWQLRRRSNLPPGIDVFAILRVVDPVVLIVASALVVGSIVVDPALSSIVGVLFTLAAIAEYVNYFHVQLMHDNVADLRRLRRSGLRSSVLARDLRRRRQLR